MKRTKIDLKTIENLNPCQGRLDNYVKHYGDKAFTIKQFLALKGITHADKCWVAFRLMPKKNIRFAAGEIAKSVLSIYEANYPNDKRPREAVKQALAKRLNKSAAAAAYAVYAAAAYAAYAAAAYYAAYAAYAAAAAAAAACAANAANAANAAAAAAVYAAKRTAQQSANLKIIAKYWR